MRKGPIIHGVVLLVALGLAWKTWTREQPTFQRRGTVTVWGGGEIQTVALEADKRSVRVEHRADGNDHYLWARVTKTMLAKKPPVPPKPPGDAGPASQPVPPPEPSEITTTTEFPIGDDGDKLLQRLAPLLALRDLGPADDAKKTEFKLADSKTKLIVTFKDGPRELVIGDRVYGGDDRYALDTRSGRIFVLPSDVVAPLEGAEGQLRERKVHGFEANAVGRVVVKTPSAEKRVVRKAGGDQAPATWAAAATPDKPDQGIANFMDRIEKLMPMEYSADLKESTLVPVVRLEYETAGGAPLGYLQVYRRQGDEKTQNEYYIRSERTRVLAKIYRLGGERIDQDLAQFMSN